MNKLVNSVTSVVCVSFNQFTHEHFNPSILKYIHQCGCNFVYKPCRHTTVTLAPLHPQHRSLIFGLYGGLAVLITMGWTFMALVLSHCIILYSVAMLKNKWMCFASGLATLASIKLEPYNSWQVSE